MAERYTRLFSLDENLYCEGAPVIVRAGALLKDNQTGNVLAQIKFQNISKKPSHIKALRVAVTPMDVRGQTLGEPIEFDYLDLSVPRDGEFGQKTPIPLPDRNARGFSVAIVYAVFDDNTEMMPQSGEYQPIPRQRTLAGALQDNDIATEYARKFGVQCPMSVTEFADLWLCSCGAVNHSSETNCHSCKNDFMQLTTVDYEQLKREFQDRMAKEAAERREQEIIAEQRRKKEEKAAEERRRKAEEEKREKLRKQKKFRKRLAIVVGIGIVLVSTILLYIKFILPEQTYKKAVALYENQKYEEAVKSFHKLTDSNQELPGCLQIIYCSTPISYDEKGRVLSIANYHFLYDDNDEVRKIISKGGNETVTFDMENDGFLLEFKEPLGWKKSKFNQYGIIQKGEEEWNADYSFYHMKIEHDYQIEVDKDTHFPMSGTSTDIVQNYEGETRYNSSYEFNIIEKNDGLVLKGKDGDGVWRYSYYIKYSFYDKPITSKIVTQNERLIMAFCVTL